MPGMPTMAIQLIIVDTTGMVIMEVTTDTQDTDITMANKLNVLSCQTIEILEKKIIHPLSLIIPCKKQNCHLKKLCSRSKISKKIIHPLSLIIPCKKTKLPSE